MRLLCCLLVMATLADPARACRLGLALTIDVSGSIDPSEYQFQMQGLADALEDGVIAEALVQAQAAVMVVQWSGAQDQSVSIPWRRIQSFVDVETLAAQVRATKRRWQGGKTAVGDALEFTMSEFAKIPDCVRKVIDVSGDGQANDGQDAGPVRNRARALGFMVNGVAIDRVGQAVAQYYRNHVIAGPGSFVMTAQGYSDYPRAIRMKLYREVVVPAS